ncbi:hypothetical protein [Proteiniphilum sp. X52]|uniref:hypothetical protein n=1 Tax=Proteiniphilum sp. X52 TaxID=2382159 RepID=UPI000F3FB5BF|nr:hypothetical protein [Proteiniphilum sp. X52]RNC64974.1 hypothetical protein D7D25_08735 [Proteiniphilum sp. X52]
MEKIRSVFGDKERYMKLRTALRQEFETRLNWDVWREKMNRILKENVLKWTHFLKEGGYSDEFVSIFFTQDQTGTWVDSPTETRNDRLHDYMRRYNHGIIDAALEEYRRDHQN